MQERVHGTIEMLEHHALVVRTGAAALCVCAFACVAPTDEAVVDEPAPAGPGAAALEPADVHPTDSTVEDDPSGDETKPDPEAPTPCNYGAAWRCIQAQSNWHWVHVRRQHAPGRGSVEDVPAGSGDMCCVRVGPAAPPWTWDAA